MCTMMAKRRIDLQSKLLPDTWMDRGLHGLARKEEMVDRCVLQGVAAVSVSMLSYHGTFCYV